MTDYNDHTWRLYISPPAIGAWNMAVDESILEHVSRGEAPPTLRLYGWEPPCLSLGRAQPFADVDISALEANGWELVRRPTGGRAILHTDELTYSVIAPASNPHVSGSLLESYHHLAQALLAALNALNVNADMKKGKATQGNNTNPVCFEVPSTYEITVDGKKLIGSAQARRKDGVLQHGSLPLTGDLARITQALVFPDEEARQIAAEKLLAHATTTEITLGQAIDWDTASKAFVHGFETALNIQLKRDELSRSEIFRLAELVGSKYKDPTWTERL